MITKSQHLNYDCLYCIKYDKIEFLKTLLDFENILNPKYSNGIIFDRMVNSEFLDSIPINIAKFNAINICKFLLLDTWWKFTLIGSTLIYGKLKFQLKCIEFGRIELLRIVGIPNKKYKDNLIKEALRHKQYNIIKWINEYN